MSYERLLFSAILFCLCFSFAASFIDASSCNQQSTKCLMTKAKFNAEIKTIKVLALHGSEGNGEEFIKRLGTLQKDAAAKSMELDITSIDGPFPKGNGFAWWNMPPGKRSYTAEEYEGFEASTSKVLSVWESNSFDIILGHSQGAILVAAIIALGLSPYHPSKGYVLNGAAYPNPYMEQLKSLKIESDKRTPPPRVLCIIGQNDQITGASIQIQLRNCLQDAGLDVSTIEHPGGHSFPTKEDETMAAVTSWFSLLG